MYRGYQYSCPDVPVSQSIRTDSPTVFETDVSAVTSTPVDTEKKSKKLASTPTDVVTDVVYESVEEIWYRDPAGRRPVI